MINNVAAPHWKRFAPVVCCMVMVMLTTGCLTAPDIERTRLYTLHTDLQMDEAEPLDLTLGVRPLFAARPYALPMAFLNDAGQLGYRVRDEWAEPPANSVTRAVTDALAATNRYKDVGNAADMARPDLLLTGELRMFHENRTESPPMAELEVRLELRPAREPGALWAATLRETEPLDGDGAADFATAMNAALARLAQRAADAIATVEPPELTPNASAPRRR